MRSWDFNFYCQWGELFRFRRMNWINFDFIKLTVEVGGYKGRYLEVEAAILGLGVCFEWHDPTSRSVFMAEMDQRMAEARDGNTVKFDDE